MNHLSQSTSPYLLQHAHNPVDWHLWNEEALNKASAENKPIFLSIGYSACHWCHVMAHESFEDQETAAIMNEHFINIKVDREERPDIDSIYMSATVAMTGSGGWPMSVFLTPDLKPFYAGTYFPPVRRYNMPAFKDVLAGIAASWQNDRTDIERVGKQLHEHLESTAKSSPDNFMLTQDHLEKITELIVGAYDWGYGGWGSAPKFPQPMTIELLFKRALSTKNTSLNSPAIKAALHALRAMARGGMYDVVGGGFARYSVDTHWRIPHFEKMLYDNAQLTLAYLHAWQITKDNFFKQIVTETLDFVLRELTHPKGGFYSALDADSEGEEGKFYAWSLDDIREILKDDADFFEAAYGITLKGNFEGLTVLQRALDDASLAARFKITLEAVPATLAESHSKLLSARALRIRPNTDDKVLAAWNGLMLSAFAESARYLDDKEKAETYLKVAQTNANFLLTHLKQDGTLHRAWREGKAIHEVFLEDYAALMIGFLDLYQTDFDNKWFVEAQSLADEMIELFTDPAGGFFDTPLNSTGLLIRPKDIQDNATPSGNALACEALLKLASFTGNSKYRDLAERALQIVSDSALKYPTAFARWLSAANQALGNSKQIAVLYEAWDDQAEALLNVIRAEYRDGVVSASIYPIKKDAPALLHDKPLINKRPTVYVCENFVCKLPVTEIEDLQSQL